MVKRKQKTSESPASKISKSCENDETLLPNEERKERLVLFDIDKNNCDVIIMTKDKEMHLPSSFLEMASNDNDLPVINGRIEIDVLADSVVKALSYYAPKFWDDQGSKSFYDIVFLESIVY